ncbi:uncharacterized protein LOC129594977 isoform X2 [Paramacrobiotus metropolitanus]|nr:uncharacterized protein LOC129594977 isoform X2 [Paramacrobiotus metropolitanus]
MENSDVPESSFYVLLTPAANYRQEPEASWHVASRSPSPGIHAPVANHRFSSTPAAKCPPPASSTLGLRMNFKRGRGVLNKENHQTNGGCVFCIRDVLEEPCPLHSHSVPDSEVLPLALATLPSSLSFIRAAADAAPGGVRAECSFSSRTVFGPMRGVMCPHAKLQPPLFGIPDRPTLHGILRFHTESPHGCNWMQFVRLATHTAEHNLTAYNVNGEVYFATKRDIAAGEELTVWYSTNYAKAMRISGRLREISNDPVPLRGRMGVLGRPVAFCDDLVWESGLPDSLPPDESIMQTDAVDLVPPAKEDSIHQEGEGNDSGSGSICIDYETAASDAENETAKAISPTGNVHESKAQYPKRGSLVHQKTIVRLKAVMAVNPYQFPVGTPRIQAFDAVVRQLDGPDLSATELTSRSKALRRLVKDCLDIFPETLQRFDKSSCDERTMEYVSLMKKLRKMVKNSCKEKEVVPRHVNADTVKKLQAVREVNPYQYPLPSAERQAAWESVMRNLLGDLETEELVIQMKKMKRLVRECLISRDDTFRRCARQRDEVTQQYKSVVEELIILAGINKDDEGKESGAEGCSSELEIRAEDAAKLPPALPVDGDGSRDSYTMETGSDLPMALDTADEGCGTDSDASSVEQPKRKRKRRTRFRHDNPEAVKRLEAIVQVNPYQYPPGKIGTPPSTPLSTSSAGKPRTPLRLSKPSSTAV